MNAADLRECERDTWARWLREAHEERDAARARIAELEDGFEPDRWWRVIYDGPGRVWCESSDEDEVRHSLTTCPSPGTLQRLYRLERRRWRDAR